MRDMAWVSLRSLSSAAELAEASAVMRALLVEPDLPEGEIERLKNQMLVGLRSQLQDPGEVAERAFYRALYDDHPYGQVLDEGDIAALDRNALLDFYRRYFVAKNTVVAIVGDLDRAGAEALAEQLVGELPEGIKPAEIPPVPVLKEARSIHVPFPSQQAHVLIGQPGLRRGDADYYSLYLGNHVFGGSGFASRLMGEVREKRGLAYSVYSYFMPMAQNGPFQMGLQTRVDQAELAVQLVHDELQRFVAEGPSADELERAQLNVTGGSALRTDSNKKLVEYLSLIGFYDLPLDYLDAFNGHIEAESVASVRDAFQRRVNPDALITVVVGGDAE
jgi:zinc protease